MKRLILDLGLLLSGTVGFTGWCIAAVLKVEPGARSRVFGCLNGAEWIPVLFFCGHGNHRAAAGSPGSPKRQLIPVLEPYSSLCRQGGGSFFGAVNS